MGCLLIGLAAGFALTKIWLVLPTGGAGGLWSHAAELGEDLGQGSDGASTYLFSSFEKEEEIRSWKTVHARIERSAEQPADGAWAARVEFLENRENYQAVILDDLVRKGRRTSDWSSYQALQLAIFNPSPAPATLKLLLTDASGMSYKEELPLPRGNGARFMIPVKKIQEALDIRHVNQIAIYSRAENPGIYFLDDVRLSGGRPPHGNERASGTSAVRQEVDALPVMSGVNPLDWGFALRRPAWSRMDPITGAQGVSVPFLIRNETPALCWLCPAEGSVPLPPGEVKSLRHLRLRSPNGEDWPFEPRVLASWPDGSIKWAGLHFDATVPAGQEAGFLLEYGEDVRSIDFPTDLEIKEERDRFLVDTGPLRTALNRKTFYLFESVWMDNDQNHEFSDAERIVNHARIEERAHGRVFRADLAADGYSLVIESRGSQRVVFRAEGWLVSDSGERFGKLIVRYTFYHGKNYIKVMPTYIYTGYPGNKIYEPYRDLPLPENETVESLSLVVPFGLIEKGPQRFALGFAGRPGAALPGNEKLTVFQKNWREARIATGGKDLPGHIPLAGWLDVSNSLHGMAVTVRDFRENFPKAFKVDPETQRLEIALWPSAAGPLDLSTREPAKGPEAYGRGSAFGLAKTHEVLFHFHGGSPAEVQDRAVSFSRRLVIRPNPYWVDATGVLGRLYPVEQAYAKPELMLERLFDWAARWQEKFEWYGMLDFGDTLTWFREEDEAGTYTQAGWHPVGRWGWYNGEGPGTHYGALLQFLRSGKGKYFRFGENLARHLMDIDTIHYNTIAEDPRLRNLLDDKMSQPGAMHRHNGQHWGGRSDEASHTNIAGLLLYFYLSGDERALEVVKETGEFFLTEPFTYIGHPDLAPQRALANALWGEVLLYEATRDERYKTAADKLIGIFLRGQQADGSFLENYNPVDGSWTGEKHVIFMSWYDVSAFIAYHQLTQDERVKEMLLKLLRYLAPQEYAAAAVTHGFSYAYFLTRDPAWAELADKTLQNLMKHSLRAGNPMLDGLIYEKPIYHRPNIFLGTVPYTFGAIEEDFRLKRNPPRP